MVILYGIWLAMRGWATSHKQIKNLLNTPGFRGIHMSSLFARVYNYYYFECTNITNKTLEYEVCLIFQTQNRHY